MLGVRRQKIMNWKKSFRIIPLDTKNLLYVGTFLSVFLLSFFSSIDSQAQARNKILYQAEYDARYIRFGYFMGFGGSSYRVKHNDLYLSTSNTNINSITSPVDYGLKLGGMINFNISDRYGFRIVPTVAIYSRRIEVNGDPDIVKTRDQAWFEIPFLLRYKSLRRGNYRMNIFAGLSPGFETNAVNLVNKNSLTHLDGLRRADLSIEYGAGAEFFRQFFKLAPEIHFSHGIRNMVDKNPNAAGINTFSFLDRLNTHTVTFYLFFE